MQTGRRHRHSLVSGQIGCWRLSPAKGLGAPDGSTPRLWVKRLGFGAMEGQEGFVELADRRAAEKGTGFARSMHQGLRRRSDPGEWPVPGVVIPCGWSWALVQQVHDCCWAPPARCHQCAGV